MGSESKIDAGAFLESLADIFTKNDFSIPNYQRDYAWRTKQVDDLLSDLDSFIFGKDDYYVLGQIITSPEKTGLTPLVDGQQRLTTLYLLILGLHRHVESFAINEAELLELNPLLTQLGSFLWRFKGASPNRNPRFLGVRNGQKTLKALVDKVDPPTPSSVSDKNLVKNFGHIQNWIEKEDRLSHPDGVADFIENLMAKVFVVRLQLASENQAIDFFIKLNSRGLKLNAADLLKGLVLKNASEDAYESADLAWNEAAQAISNVAPSGAANMEFLLGAMIRKKLGKRVSKEQLYFEWESQILARSRPFQNIRKVKALTDKLSVDEFIDSLTHNAQALKSIGAGKQPRNDAEAGELRGTRLFKSFQHYNVLLAGADLGVDPYNQLARAVEARTILSLFGDEPSQDFERILPAWAHRIGKLVASGEQIKVEDVRLACVPAFDDTTKYLERIETVIRKLRYADENDVNRQRDITRIRYVLARVTRRTEIQAGMPSGPLSPYLETRETNSDIYVPKDIDHILARSAKSVQRNWPDDYPLDLIHSIGNMVLLYSEINSKLRDADPIKKADSYLDQEYALSKALIEQHEVSKESPKRHRASVLWNKAPVDLSSWGPKDIELRTKLYVSLFKDDLEESIKPFLKA